MVQPPLSLSVRSDRFFPLSHLWAAGSIAGDSVERYLDEVRMSKPPRFRRSLERQLRALEPVRARDIECRRAWDEAFFGRTVAVALADVERVRLFSRHAYNQQRWRFAPSRAQGMAMPFRWQVPSVSEVEAVYGDFLADPARAFALPGPMPKVPVSQPFSPRIDRMDYWLRFSSRSARVNDEVNARVHESAGVANPSTVILGPGIFVEFDHCWKTANDTDGLRSLGIRVVRPEAPWQGRRMPCGRYGGEPFIATVPCGALDLFTAAVQELAVLMDWCRSTGTGPVRIGGQSLGAMTAQFVADKPRRWPNRLQPDAMLPSTPCGRVEEVAVHGSLARVWGIADSMAARSWTLDTILSFLRLLDLEDDPKMPPDRFVAVPGTHDDITPFTDALELADRWRVPHENRFIWRRGHFSVPTALLRNHAPFVRFGEILNRLA